LIDITDVDNSEILDFVADAVEYFVLSHTIWVPVSAKANNYKAFLLAQDCLINMPAGVEMWQNDGTHILSRIVTFPLDYPKVFRPIGKDRVFSLGDGMAWKTVPTIVCLDWKLGQKISSLLLAPSMTSLVG
jgi:hypothetical protein